MKPDGEDLKWLARNLRAAYLNTDHHRKTVDFWLAEIRTDFGATIAEFLQSALRAEVEPFEAIQAARDVWLSVKGTNDGVIDALAAQVDEA